MQILLAQPSGFDPLFTRQRMMHDLPENALSSEFRRERSVRRTATLLEAKRLRIHDELQHLVRHLALLVPAGTQTSESYAALLQDAAERIGDDAFTQLLLQVLQEIS